MKALLTAMLELCLLRIGPQNLPGAPVLVLLSTGLNLLVGLLLLGQLGETPVQALQECLFDLSLTFGVLLLALKARGLLDRFPQTASAIMLSNLLLNCLALPLAGWSHQAGALEAGLLLRIVVVWNILVLGHILRHTFTLPLSQGVAASLLFTIFSWTLSYLMFPVGP